MRGFIVDLLAATMCCLLRTSSLSRTGDQGAHRPPRQHTNRRMREAEPASRSRAVSIVPRPAAGVNVALHARAKARYTPTNPLVVDALEHQAEAVAGTMNAQAAGNTLWAYATMGRKPGAGMMRVLEGRAEAVAGTMNAQDVANTLWAYARMGREPGAGMMGVLEGRAEAVAGTMNAQAAGNTLWAYATMGREPGAGMMRVLEGRAEEVAGMMNAQAAGNTLWAYARMGREPGARLRCSLEERILQVVADVTSQGIADSRWAYSLLGLSLPAQVETCLAARLNAIASSLSDFVAAEAGRGGPPEAHCDAQSVAGESVASVATALTAKSRSTDRSQASTVQAGVDVADEGGWAEVKPKDKPRR
jgi:hypothetical protein